MKTIYIYRFHIRYLKMYEYPPSGRAEEICGRSASHDSHHQALYQSADGQQNHRVHVAYYLDQSSANGEEDTRQECEKESVPSRALPISLAIVGKLFGVVIDRMDAVVGRSGLYIKLHRGLTLATHDVR